MGVNQSLIDPIHIRIYSNMIQIDNPIKRSQIIQTCLSSPEYINSAKRAGVYSYLLRYLSAVQSHDTPILLPGEQPSTHTPTQTQYYTHSIPQTPHPYPAQSTQSSYASQSAQSAQPYKSITPFSGERGQVPVVNSSRSTQLTIQHPAKSSEPSWKAITTHKKQKAISYFSSCLEVLNIQEEIELTPASLKSAYRKMALKAHPDKGGSEEYFEAVTRAYAYLSEIITIIKSRSARSENNINDVDISNASSQRDNDAQQWNYKGDGIPIKLDADNLDMNAFNKLFEETHMPDPDSDGYGEWLRSTNASSETKRTFKGEFNRDVFNKMFDEDSKKNGVTSTNLIVHPEQMALVLNPSYGTDLLNERPESYTTAPNAKMQFTDLRGAYTSESTISDKVANVQVGNRNYDQYKASREKKPDPFSQTEIHSIREFENRQKSMDSMRERKQAEMTVRNQRYFDNMKQLVITSGTTPSQNSLSFGNF
jgi:curved DNA-binding protein CbpA